MSKYANGYTVNTRMPKNMFLELKRDSKESGLSMSHIMRDAYRKSKQPHGTDAPAGKKKAK